MLLASCRSAGCAARPDIPWASSPGAAYRAQAPATRHIIARYAYTAFRQVRYASVSTTARVSPTRGTPLGSSSPSASRLLRRPARWVDRRGARRARAHSLRLTPGGALSVIYVSPAPCCASRPTGHCLRGSSRSGTLRAPLPTSFAWGVDVGQCTPLLEATTSTTLGASA